MYHCACIAVEIAYKVVNHKIADDLFNVHYLVDSCALVQLLEGGNQPAAVLVSNICFCVFKDILIAGKLVVCIDKGHIIAAHASRPTALPHTGHLIGKLV